ncbi:exodeoxyribonuclease V subunit beta [Mycolicibacterium flavescens]|uniref:RecBCD enzyme subunit RecB n=1 Tax=Mycolicibacterium flavescens TaxID=1776 RepID=A0A1E3RLS9_MYCFV|nr:exodeoxyribonuclease V subunit beta [Mycolicibacterium flavescens]MCV7281765.1 exodeoxyribonuclease V subunit beta [Mycolicibacterium flavescens]ODQ90845.1 exodeoxyribonuclease V subunit beta [Mycolicibacterium flavescens]
MEPFDLSGDLPAPRTTTVLEASAGTGKTFALAGLVTRYLAEGVATLDQMLLITFSRAASQELRDRVRRQIVDAVQAFGDPAGVETNEIIDYLRRGSPEEIEVRERNLRDALAAFDAATIATTHQFCQLVLRSLGVAGDSDSGVTLVESLDELVTEIVDDLYLHHFGRQRDDPLLTYPDALRLAKEVVKNPATELRPADPEPESRAAVCLRFAKDVLAELEKRKRQRGILGYDDLLSRLADALAADGSAAQVRMPQRWPIVMVDEFQDTDPVQWQVIDRAFTGRSTLILIGDPKQAIYAFRGGDIVTYLSAASKADVQKTLATNWRSDAALVNRLQAVLRGAQLGHSKIVVHDVAAKHTGSRLAGAPCTDPFRLRVVRRETLGRSGTGVIPIDQLRTHIPRDLAADVALLLDSDATFDGRPLGAGDIAVIVETHKDARACYRALCDAGIPAVYTGDSDVFTSDAAKDWLALLEAFDQPHRPGVVRAAAATMFFGETAATLVAGGDELTDRIAETLREWASHARERGVAAIFEAAQLAGMSDRVLGWQNGERQMTDLAHMTQLLQEAAHREHFTLPALRDWLRAQCEEGSGTAERFRRLDNDAAAVQVMTVFVAKGLQFPVVYLPFAFNRHVREPEIVLYHEGETRCLHIGGNDSPDFHAVSKLGRQEDASDDSRLMYVAMTRAQSQLVTWWAPAHGEPHGGLSRLLRGRRPGEAMVPDTVAPLRVSDDDAMARLQEWAAIGGPSLEDSVPRPIPARPRVSESGDFDVRHFHRPIDAAWRRTSYSGLIRAVEATPVSSEPEVVELDDEVAEIALTSQTAGADVPSPMADLPTGAKFGTLVHAVLEDADPFATDLAAELEARIREHAVWWPVDVSAEELAAALVPLHDTPLGPLADGVTLRQIGLEDRMREMEFEFPLAGGDLRTSAPDIRLAHVGALLREHLDVGDPMRVYADRLAEAGLGTQSLKGYLSGSVDAVLRVPDDSGGRYLVVDYKTNWLGDPARPLTAADYARPRLVEAMLHSDYPLQALLYSVVLHRFLRWRLPGYDPSQHLGGVLYLYLRGMCGADTPVVDGDPAGVFSWRPPAALITALSDLLDAGRAAA